MTKPSSPKDLVSKSFIPDFVIVSATFKLKDIKELIFKKAPSEEGQFILNWLNFEDIYRNDGWVVLYDQPGYNETYDPYYQFTRK